VEEADPVDKKAQKGAKPGKEKAIETSDTVEEVVEVEIRVKASEAWDKHAGALVSVEESSMYLTGPARASPLLYLAGQIEYPSEIDDGAGYSIHVVHPILPFISLDPLPFTAPQSRP
jgi:hypothetical protein